MSDVTKIERPACTLDECITRIRQSHEAVGKHQRQALENAYDVGQYLTIAKQQVDHGEWLDWVEENCPFRRTQAAKYMRLVQHWDAVLGQVKGDMQLGLDAALALITEKPNGETSHHLTTASESQTADNESQPDLSVADDAEWEYLEKDEDEPLEEGEIDCGPVEPEPLKEPEPVDWKKPLAKARATCEALMRCIDDVREAKPDWRGHGKAMGKAKECWEVLK